jgi:choline dehydrogenase-like flavoprotein
MIPLAQASGNCEIRAECAAFRVETDDNGRATRVHYFDPEGNEVSQNTKAVILSANGAETSRLLLLSATDKQAHGLANSSGFVGRNLMYNCHSEAKAEFDEQLNEYKGVQVTRIVHDFYESDPARSFYGGGGIDARPLDAMGPLQFALAGGPPGESRWGAGYKASLARRFTRQLALLGSTTSLAQDSNNVTLDPTHTDQWGRPSLRITYMDHEDDLAAALFLQDKAMSILDAAGARNAWRVPVHAQDGGAHLLGTCRMGNDPESSVVDRFHRTHDVQNLFICDGSSFVTSGRGQPTMTIMALAFRAAEHIAAAARANEI